MTVELYLSSSDALGIKRGQLADGFEPPMTMVGGYRAEADRHWVSQKVKPPPVDIPERLLRRPTLRQVVARNGMTIEALSKLTGLSVDHLKHSLRDERRRKSMMSRVGPHLTDAQKRELGWEV